MVRHPAKAFSPSEVIGGNFWTSLEKWQLCKQSGRSFLRRIEMLFCLLHYYRCYDRKTRDSKLKCYKSQKVTLLYFFEEL